MKTIFRGILAVAGIWLLHMGADGQCTISNNALTLPSPAWFGGTQYNVGLIRGSTPVITGGCSLGGYQWQAKPQVGQWQDISGATTRDYDPDLQLATKSYRRVVRASDNTTNNSPEVTLEVYPTAEVDVSILADPPGQICTGDQVTFSAQITNGGNNPTYQWYVDNVLKASSSTYTYIPDDGAQIKCRVTSNSHCISGSNFDEDFLVMDVSNGPVVPVLIISIQQGTSLICEGTSVTFTAFLTAPGNTPRYQWFLGTRKLEGETNKTFVTSQLIDKDTVRCSGVSSLSCADPDSVSSNFLAMTVIPRADAGTLVQKSVHGCLNEPDTLELTGYKGVISEWQQNRNDEGWKTYSPGYIGANLRIENTQTGTFSYRVLVGSQNFCPPDTSNSVTVPVFQSNRQTLVEKAPEAHRARGDVFLICTTCNNALDTLNYTYAWGYTAQDTDIYQPDFRNKAFCLFPERLIGTHRYFLDVIYQSQKTPCDRTYATGLLADDDKSTASLLAYPNPNTGIFRLIATSAYLGDCECIMTNMVGRTIMKRHLMKSEQAQEYQISTGHLDRGAYIITLSCGHGEPLKALVLVY